MQVTLIYPGDVVAAYGVRMLSAVLKAAGVAVRLVALPQESDARWTVREFDQPYPPAVLEELAGLAQDSDLIGVSLMTNHFERAVQLTAHLRGVCDCPILWGGVHPTVSPEQCLEHADIICVGEGEEPLLELVERLAAGRDYTDVRNLWSKRDGELLRTPLRPPPTDLDAWPYQDYDLTDEWVLHGGCLQRMTRDLLIEHLRAISWERGYAFRTMLSRGCRYRCTFCCNSSYGKLFGRDWRLRRRSVAHFIGEVRRFLERFPEVRYVVIDDDHFLDDAAQVRAFCQAWRAEVGVSFSLAGLYPAMVDEATIAMLVEAGMCRASVGVQTGSPRVMRDVFHRPCSTEQLHHAFDVLSRFPGRFTPVYQVILDNPWETDEDQLATLRLLLTIPGRYTLECFSLTLYPGSGLHERARREELVLDDVTDVCRKNYEKPRRSYLNLLYPLFAWPLARRWVLPALLWGPLRRRGWTWLPAVVTRGLRAAVAVRARLRRVLTRGEPRTR
jgi:radical SAM superfamily enzyme YgiQ (UPF0313 family)